MGPAVIAVAAVASTVAGVVNAAQSHSAAKKQESLAKRRQKLEAVERETAAAREKARLARQGRLKKASILNSATVQGAGQSSAAQGAQLSVDTQVRDAQGYVNVQNLLARDSADLTTRQIEMNSKNQQTNAIFKGIGAVTEGVGTAAYYGAFDGVD